MSIKTIEVIETKEVRVCDQCECNIPDTTRWYTMKSPYEDYQEIHLCSSTCFKQHIISWSVLLKEGNGVRAMFEVVS